MLIQTLKVLLYKSFLETPHVPAKYGITVDDIVKTATPATWDTLKSLYTPGAEEHYNKHPRLLDELAMDTDPAVRLALALHPTLAGHVAVHDENDLIRNYIRLHHDGHAMLPGLQTVQNALKAEEAKTARNTPAKPAFELTEQQKSIIEHPPTSNQVIIAGAGSGKTSTLVEYAKAWPDHKFMYLAFNAAIRDEAKRVMPRNVNVLTTHGLAHRSLNISRISRGNLKGSLYRDDIINAAEQVHADQFLTSMMIRATTHSLKQYLNSADDTLQYHHLFGFEWPTEDKEPPRNALPIIKPVVEHLMDFMNGNKPFTHEMYLKHFCVHYNQPIPDIHALLIDETQDTSPSFVAYLERTGLPLILVGDSYQAIYGFRGAVDAMNQFKGPRRSLTRSWRFGEELAETANFILTHASKPPDYKIHGNPKRTTSIHYGTATTGLILARTNAALFEHLIRVDQNFHIQGGYQAFKNELQHAMKLYEADGSFVPGVLPYKTWDALLMASEDEDPTAMRLEALLNNRPPSDLRNHLQRLDHLATDKPSNASIHLSTAHKAKGLQSPTTSILSDFMSLRKRDTFKQWLISQGRWDNQTRIEFDQELHLLYVAVTRAETNLYIDDPDLHFELTNHELSAPEQDPNAKTSTQNHSY